jgi:TM2 domain-containing membrane protein YozV
MAGPEINMAYLFWIPSLFGVAGLHRFYLGKPLTGLLYLFTGGLLGLGTIYDGLTMPQQVRAARLARRLDSILDEQGGRHERYVGATGPVVGRKRGRDPSSRRFSISPRNVTASSSPSRVAIRAEVGPEKARDQLDRLVSQGFAEVHVTREGILGVRLSEFLDDIGRRELEDLG